MIKIAIDCLGGDKSPDANIEGSVLALNKFSDLELVLFGDENVINEKLARFDYPKERLSIVHAPLAVDGNDKPIDAVRMKKDSSMISAVRTLREDDTVSALVSCGATGVLVGASILRIGRLNGVRRPAFCPVMPTMNGGIVGICDSGANIEVTAEQLRQYAVMANGYLEAVYDIKSPKVALLNVGTEEEKGDDLRREAYKLLKNQKGLNFVGNMESRDLLSGKYDLVVCDGFSGNVLCKSTEGACLEMLKRLKKDVMSSFINKIGALFMMKTVKKEVEFMNYQNYGGSVLLGLEKTVVKGHGSSNAKAFSVCIEQAYKMTNENLNDKILHALADNN